MADIKVCAVIFEGGQARTSLDKTIFNIRNNVTLDTAEKLLKVKDIDDVCLVTNRRELASDAENKGIKVEYTCDGGGSQFHFGTRLRDVIDSLDADGVIYLGGAAVPLLSTDEFQDIACSLKKEDNIVMVNNVQSADLVAFRPAMAVHNIPLPDQDNTLGNLLRNAGLPRVLLPNSGSVNFDLDTPTDILVMELHPLCGPRARESIKALDWSRETLQKAVAVLRQKYMEIGIIGRVGPSVVQYINSTMVHRIRVFSEERGMKALGREARGEVRSLVGYMLEELGPERFFRHLSSVCHVVFFDTRVIFNHMRKNLTDWDRFYSDLGKYDLIQDEWAREFTKCAVEAPIPVLLGGHSLVAAGLWLLAEMIVTGYEG